MNFVSNPARFFSCHATKPVTGLFDRKQMDSWAVREELRRVSGTGKRKDYYSLKFALENRQYV
ncbi:hypothetical protein [Wolbachia endosymbiont of Tettigetta isshikii]|uniref:hypothetical protein n=1 Tax=Wolbachia endosymbiont of Tettigetta isshikii TaxID=3239093 RepID=UPI00398144CB